LGIGSGYYLSLLNRKTFPIEYGISFNNFHANSLGLDWKEVYETMIKDLHPKYIRISATWKEMEAQDGVFDFQDIDWQMDMAAQYGVKVILVVGQKAPRWPECHIPDWVGKDTDAHEDLLRYVRTTVTRYKDHPALDLWQVENEPFIRFQFGECQNYDSGFIHDEIAMVKEIDPTHSTIVTDSGEMGLWWGAVHTGDYFGTTLYRIVKTNGGRTFTYDWLPAIAYRLKAVLTGVKPGRFFISELQAEPWFTNTNPTNTPIEEQEKTMNPERLKRHIEYAKHIGAQRAYLWGVEWWYFMKKEHGDERYWEIVKDVLK